MFNVLRHLSGLTNIRIHHHDWLSGGQILQCVPKCSGFVAQLKHLSVHCFMNGDISLDVSGLEALRLESASFAFGHGEESDDSSSWSDRVVLPIQAILSGQSKDTLKQLALCCSSCTESEPAWQTRWQNYAMTSRRRQISITHSISHIIPDNVVFAMLESLVIGAAIYVGDGWLGEHANAFPVLDTLVVERCYLVPLGVQGETRRLVTKPDVSLPRLRRLYVDCIESSELTFSSSVTPSLKEIVLDCWDYDVGAFSRICKAFHQRSFPEFSFQITSLCLSKLFVNDEKVIAKKILPMFPHLENLKLLWNVHSTTPIDCNFWYEMISGEFFLPKLTRRELFLTCFAFKG